MKIKKNILYASMVKKIILGSCTFIVHITAFNTVDTPWGLPSTFQRLGMQLVADSHWVVDLIRMFIWELFHAAIKPIKCNKTFSY